MKFSDNVLIDDDAHHEENGNSSILIGLKLNINKKNRTNSKMSSVTIKQNEPVNVTKIPPFSQTRNTKHGFADSRKGNKNGYQLEDDEIWDVTKSLFSDDVQGLNPTSFSFTPENELNLNMVSCVWYHNKLFSTRNDFMVIGKYCRTLPQGI